MRYDSAIVLAVLIAWRIVNTSLLKTFFQPDEYWQALEPAHRIAFGYGYLTWEWREGLRSAAHPLLFAGAYKIADWLGLDVVAAPRALQAVIAAAGDWYTYRLAERLLGQSTTGAKWALAAAVFSGANWYISARTFSNSLETTLTAVALTYWPWNADYGVSTANYVVSLAIAAMTCVFRPTNALVWVFLGVRLLWQVRARPSLAVRLAVTAIATGSLALGLSAIVDYQFYGHAVFPPAKFIAFNVVRSLSRFYGVAPWHYYLAQGVPLVLLGFLPVTLLELWRRRASAGPRLVVFVVFMYSLLAHKEFRFILPLVPLLHVYFGAGMARVAASHSTLSARMLFVAFAAINLAVAGYLGTFHQRGVVDVIEWIRDEPTVSSVGILMPCHSTPWQAHLRRPDIDAWFLTCEPPLTDDILMASSFATHGPELVPDPAGEYLDEADQFYWNPTQFLEKTVPAVHDWPSHVVFFDNLRPVIDGFFTDYREVARFFNSHFHEDRRRYGDVVVYARVR